MFYAASVISMSTVDGEERVVEEKGEGGVKDDEEKKWLCDEVEEEGLEQKGVGAHGEEGHVHAEVHDHEVPDGIIEGDEVEEGTYFHHVVETKLMNSQALIRLRKRRRARLWPHRLLQLLLWLRLLRPRHL